MGRKASPYAKKRAIRPLTTPVAVVGGKQIIGIDMVVARCTPYAENKVFNPDVHLLPVRLALEGMLKRTIPSNDLKSHDALSHAIGEAYIRYAQINDSSSNSALGLLLESRNALFRARQRWRKTGQWGLDGPAIQQLKDAVSLYEEVLMLSSPQQMYDAAMERLKWLKEQATDPELRAMTKKIEMEAVE